jgi:hypothetical protein
MAFYTQSIPKEVLEKSRQYIEQAQNIILVSHTNPDGDALGSSLGLWHYTDDLIWIDIIALLIGFVFLRFYRQPVQVGSTAQGAARRSPTAHVCLLISQNYSLFIFQYS